MEMSWSGVDHAAAYSRENGAEDGERGEVARAVMPRPDAITNKVGNVVRQGQLNSGRG